MKPRDFHLFGAYRMEPLRPGIRWGNVSQKTQEWVAQQMLEHTQPVDTLHLWLNNGKRIIVP